MSLCIWETRTLHSACSGHASTAERESWSDVLVSWSPKKPWALFELESSSIRARALDGCWEKRMLVWRWSEKAQGRRAQMVRVLCTRGARPGAVSGGGQVRTRRRARLSCSEGEAIRIRHPRHPRNPVLYRYRHPASGDSLGGKCCGVFNTNE